MPHVQRFQELSEIEQKELWASLALRHCKGLGARTCKLLVTTYGSAFNALQQKSHWANIGVRPQAIHSVTTETWRDQARVEWGALAHCNPHIIMWHSGAYPSSLREISDSPILLYGEGDFSLLAAPCLAIVGSRNASKHGLKVTQHLARQLAACGITIVAGMARGIDSAAHQAAVSAVGRTIGVLGTGIDICYPEENRELFAQMRQQGLLLTEFAPQTKPLANNFPIRNRLISGLSLGVLVVEATEKSGSLITARLALEQNRDVYAVPGPAMDARFKGGQRLVREGARPVFNADDIVRDLAPQLQSFGVDVSEVSFEQEDTLPSISDLVKTHPVHLDKNPDCNSQSKMQPEVVSCNLQALEPEQQKIVHFLAKQGESHQERLAMELDLSMQSLNAHLMELELAGVLKRMPGAHFALQKGVQA